MNKLFILIALAITINSCRKGLQEELVPLDLNVNDIGTITVIDAKIEKDSATWVQISYSQDINALFSPNPVYEANAIVEINDGNISEQLVYFQNGTYKGSNILGQVGSTYTINITISGVNYSASSIMNAPATMRDITSNYYINNDGKGGTVNAYSENWVVNDPSADRNRYLFEWYTNGVHNTRIDWAIDDNRVVNANEGLSLFNPQRDIYENEHTYFRVSEIDKTTYDYFNMYEKIVRGIASAGDQTPYNPVSSFGIGTIGNFRAVAFTSYPVHTPPSLNILPEQDQNQINFASNNLYVSYNLYWSNSPNVSVNSNLIGNISYSTVEATNTFIHDGLSSGTYYYKIEAEDSNGIKSKLSQTASAIVN